MDRKVKFLIFSVVLLLLSIPLLVFLAMRRQNLSSGAWSVAQYAQTQCASDGTVSIEVSFTNREVCSPKDARSMDVVAIDLQTGNSIDLGAVGCGQTKSGRIQTGRESLADGTVEFSLSWTSKAPGVQKAYANYKGREDCLQPSPTLQPTPTEEPTPEPTQPEPTQPQATATLEPTPTVPICPKPEAVTNIRIDCPICK